MILFLYNRFYFIMMKIVFNVVIHQGAEMRAGGISKHGFIQRHFRAIPCPRSIALVLVDV